MNELSFIFPRVISDRSEVKCFLIKIDYDRKFRCSPEAQGSSGPQRSKNPSISPSFRIPSRVRAKSY